MANISKIKINGSTYDIKDTISGYATETYADNAAAAVKDELLNGAGAAYDTLKELGELIEENDTAIDALEQVAINKQDKLTGNSGQFVVINELGVAGAADVELGSKAFLRVWTNEDV